MRLHQRRMADDIFYTYSGYASDRARSITRFTNLLFIQNQAPVSSLGKELAKKHTTFLSLWTWSDSRVMGIYLPMEIPTCSKHLFGLAAIFHIYKEPFACIANHIFLFHFQLASDLDSVL